MASDETARNKGTTSLFATGKSRHAILFNIASSFTFEKKKEQLRVVSCEPRLTKEQPRGRTNNCSQSTLYAKIH